MLPPSTDHWSLSVVAGGLAGLTKGRAGVMPGLGTHFLGHCKGKGLKIKFIHDLLFLPISTIESGVS